MIRENTHLSDYRLLNQQFFRLLPYQVLMLLINAANVIVDSLCASNFIGKDAMGAIGLYAPMDHLLYAISIVLVSGSQLLVGKSLGKNHVDSLQSIFSTDLLTALGVSLATSCLMILALITNLFHVFVSDDATLSAINQYLIGMAPGIPALVLGQQLFSFLSMENQTRRTTAAGLACIGVNVLMDAVLVVWLKMGSLGLGLGSSVALWTFFGVMAWHYFTGKSDIRFSARAFQKSMVLSIVRQGYPGAISRFVEMFRCIIVNVLIVRYVTAAGLSAFAAVNSVMAIFWPLPFGMMSVARMLLGISIGEEDRKSVTDIMRIGCRQGVLVQSGVSLLIILLAVPITQLFYRNPTDPVFQMTVNGLRILPLCMPLAVISLLFACYAQAAEKKLLSHLLPVVDGAVGVVLFSLILMPSLQLNGLFIANVLNGVLCSAIILLHAWLSLHRMPRNMEDLLVLPRTFGVDEDARIDIEVRQMSEVAEVARSISAFCERRGINRRQASLAGLAMEEMAGNVVHHGFTADQKPHFIDIRVVHKENDLILRIRDNCIPFNPSERAAMLSAPVGDGSDSGIRIVFGLARDVQYQYVLGLNVLTIQL